MPDHGVREGGTFLFVAILIQNCPFLNRDERSFALYCWAVVQALLWTPLVGWAANFYAQFKAEITLAFELYGASIVLGWIISVLVMTVMFRYLFQRFQDGSRNMGEINRPGYKVGW